MMDSRIHDATEGVNVEAGSLSRSCIKGLSQNHMYYRLSPQWVALLRCCWIMKMPVSLVG